MSIGKSRDRRRGRLVAPEPRDPAATEAYEHGWYALLAQHADEVEEGELGLATVTELVVEPDREPEPAAEPEADLDRAVERTPPRPRPAPVETAAAVTAPVAPAPADRPAIRIGVRRVGDAESLYLRYLTASRHREFFRAEVWPASHPITAVQLWRANHLGAGWELDQVERFVREVAEIADSMVASAPRGAPPGSPERRAWVERLLSSGWVREFGVGRVSKTLFPLVPDLLPDLDPELTSWAPGRWFGIGESEGADELDRALETWELLEDVLVLRGRPLAAIARRFRSVAPGLAPVGPLGLVQALLWEDHWSEPTRGASAPRRRTTAKPKPKRPATPVVPEPADETDDPEPAPGGTSRARSVSRSARPTAGTTAKNPRSGRRRGD
jgi:hypothetical protein